MATFGEIKGRFQPLSDANWEGCVTLIAEVRESKQKLNRLSLGSEPPLIKLAFTVHILRNNK